MSETTSRTWVFAEDEGGATVVTVNDQHLTVDVHTGPDCDGTTTVQHLEFTQWTTESGWPVGTWDNSTRRRQSDPIYVLATDPQDAYDEWVDRQLGSYLRSRYLQSQPTDV